MLDRTALAFSSRFDSDLQFIDVVTKASPDNRRAHPGLTPWTQDVQAVRLLNHEIYGSRVILVDTPPFEDSTRSCMEIIELIENWLEKL